MIITHLLLALLWISWCTMHSAMISLSVTRYLEHRLGQGYRFYRLFFNAVAVATLLPVYLYGRGIDSPLCLMVQGPLQTVRIALLLTALLLFVSGARVYDLKHFTGLGQIRQQPFSSSGDTIPFKTSGILTVTRHPWYLGGILLIWTYQAQMTMADVMVNAILSLYFVVGAMLEDRKLKKTMKGTYDQYAAKVSMLFPAKWFRYLLKHRRLPVSTRLYPAHPVLAVGAVVFKADHVLLVQRKNPPSQGGWAIPGGRVRLGESIQEAVQREVLEETGVIITPRETVFAFDAIERDGFDKVRYHYHIVDVAGDYVSGEPMAGDDALDARWVSRQALAALPVNEKTKQLLETKFDFQG
jgi:ADP-ribose pyrophosphatase YjhB (NUDIX family)/protein-S-isoprenylcysteine O-methyltransferase Ste14